MLKVYLQRKQAADGQELFEKLQPHDTGLDTVRQDESEAGQDRDEPSRSMLEKLLKYKVPSPPFPRTNSICGGEQQAQKCFAEVGSPQNSHQETQKKHRVSTQ